MDDLCEINFVSGGEGNTVFHLFYARGNASDETDMIPISNATRGDWMGGPNHYFIRGDNTRPGLMDESPPETVGNRTAVNALVEELKRQGYELDYQNRQYAWYNYKFRRRNVK